MKKVLSVLLIALLCLSAITASFGSIAEAGIEPTADLQDAEKLFGQDIPPKHDKFILSCSADKMLYGFPTVTIDGVTYAFSDNQLCCASQSADRATAILDNCAGDNLNCAGSQLIFSVIENGRASIKSYDILDGEYKTILSLSEGRIKYLYVVNASDIYFLFNGTVYVCKIDGSCLETANNARDVESFIPTDSGILYAIGEGDSSRIFLDNALILSRATYYSVINDYFVASVDSELYQLPMSDLRSAVSYVEHNSLKCFDILQYMSEFDLYGTYDAYDILYFLDSAEYHSDIEVSECQYSCFDSNREFDVHISAVYFAAGDMIIAQADRLMSYKWTPKESIRSYPCTNSVVFQKNVEQTGIPYSLGEHFPASYQHERKCIVYYDGLYFYTPGSGCGGISLDSFGNEIANVNSRFYAVEEELSSSSAPGPLYGCDCSGFVSYSWRIMKIGTSHFQTSSSCTALPSSVSVLRPGDALVRYTNTNTGNHCILIKSVSNSEIVVWEQTPPKTKETSYTISAFNSKDFGITCPYIPYRLNTVDITLNVNGGQTHSPSTYTVAPNFTLENVTLPTPIRSGYRFLGWYTAESGGIKVDGSYVVTGNIVLYAHWIHDNIIVDSPAIISSKISCVLSDSEN